jgi:hypothetical protein
MAQLAESLSCRKNELTKSCGLTLKLCFATFPSSIHTRIRHCSLFFLRALILCGSHPGCEEKVSVLILVLDITSTYFWALANLFPTMLHCMLWHFVSGPFWNTRLITNNDAFEKVWIGLTGWDEVFVTYDTVLLLLLCETVWKKLHADLLLSQIFGKNLMSCLSVNVQLILRHLIVLGYHFMNCCNCFQILNSWSSPLFESLLHSSCPCLNLWILWCWML